MVPLFAPLGPDTEMVIQQGNNKEISAMMVHSFRQGYMEPQGSVKASNALVEALGSGQSLIKGLKLPKKL